MRSTIIKLSVLLSLLASATNAEDYPKVIEGKAVVTDGDSIKINGHRIRLQGIDAPELSQKCYRFNHPFQCGLIAKGVLQGIITNSAISCKIEGVDRYNRYLGHCFINSTNLNARMVETGHALAYRQYSDRYIPEEERARANNAGIHSSKYTYPWEWRKSNRNKK